MAAELSAQNVREWTAGYLAHLLDRPRAEIDLFRPLSDYGLDSVDAVVMAGELEEHFQTEINPALFLSQATLGELIDQAFQIDPSTLKPAGR